MIDEKLLHGPTLRRLALGALLATGTAEIHGQPGQSVPGEGGATGVPAVELTFEEHEPGQDGQLVRMLITPTHLRMDDGTGSDDFVLLDRESKVLYSTDSVRRSVVTVTYRERKVEPPIPLVMDEGTEDMGDAPDVAGNAPVHRYLDANGARCYDTISVPGVLEEAAAAMGEMRALLASEHARILGSLPADVHEACDLAINVFAADWPARAGLPLREWGADGYRRALTGYREDARVAAGLFLLPEGYVPFKVGEKR